MIYVMELHVIEWGYPLVIQQFVMEAYHWVDDDLLMKIHDVQSANW